MGKGTLFVCGTPIGNLRDITLRALDTLGQADLVAAEDTRISGKLLAHFDIKRPMLSYHSFNEAHRTPQILRQLEEGKQVALISRAGMPGISDPGERLIKAAIDAGHQVRVIPGPSAGLTALVASGLSPDSYLFLGFLPRKQGERAKKLHELAGLSHTLIIYESPKRIARLLLELEESWGDRRCALARELTKLFEQTQRGTLSQVRESLPEKVKGEVVLVVEGASGATVFSEREAAERIGDLLSWGVPPKAATRIVAKEFAIKHKQAYQLVLQSKKGNQA